MRRNFGWVKPKGYVYARLKYPRARAAYILDGVSPAPSADCSGLVKILDQGNLGSCTVHAIAQIIRAAMLSDGAPPTIEFLSRLWAYALALGSQGTPGRDCGTHLATAIDILATYGFPPERYWPYDTATFGQKPSPACYHSALDQRDTDRVAYHQIAETGDSRLLTIKRAITTGRLVAFGTAVDPSALDAYSAGDTLDIPPDGSPVEGHAMAVIGYDNDRFKIANSWGEEFGDGGYLWITPRYLSWGETDDLWIVSHSPRFSGEA